VRWVSPTTLGFADKFLRANKINAISAGILTPYVRWVKLIKLYHLFYILLVIEHKTGCCVCKLAGSIYYHVAIIKAAARRFVINPKLADRKQTK